MRTASAALYWVGITAGTLFLVVGVASSDVGLISTGVALTVLAISYLALTIAQMATSNRARLPGGPGGGDRATALAALAERRRHRPAKVDNATLPAGSPMYYYCTTCGHESDVKPEAWFLVAPRTLCGECQGLKDRDWLA